MQVPAARIVTAPPALHTVGEVEEKLTGKPDEAVAVTPNGAVPKETDGKAANVMLCAAGVTVKLCGTGAAAA